MKRLLFISLLLIASLFQSAFARTIEIDVFGMTCPFCVDSLERKFGKIESVSKVEVSLKLKKIRLETKDDSLSVDAIKQTVLDAGFTPTNVTVLDDVKK
jgi:copper ion binding protein